jgi:hypothetical protein
MRQDRFRKRLYAASKYPLTSTLLLLAGLVSVRKVQRMDWASCAAVLASLMPSLPE